jgi:hypothetical protein
MAESSLLLVADGVQNFGNLETLEATLTEGKKFKIGLALAHQTIKQTLQDSECCAGQHGHQDFHVSVTTHRY